MGKRKHALTYVPEGSDERVHVLTIPEDELLPEPPDGLVHKPMEEVRITDPNTGGQKGQKLAAFDLIPAGPLFQLAEHYGKGARKYATRNWERGYDWSLCFAAMQRHLWQWWNGEDIDEETGSSHLAAAAWHCFALMEFMETHPEKDDRPKGGGHGVA